MHALHRPYHALLGAVALALTGRGAPPGEEPVALRPGVVHAGRLELRAGDEWSASFTIDVPEKALVLDITLACAFADLDLVVAHEAADEELSSEHEFGVERVVLDRFSEVLLRPGLHTIDVHYPWSEPPVWEGRALATVDYELRARVLVPRVDGVLRPGVPQAGLLDTEGGRFRSYTIDVPEGAAALRIDVLETSGDPDLLARRGGPILRVEQAPHVARHPFGRETLLVTRESGVPLAPGTYHVDVVDYGAFGDPPTSFTLLAGFDAAPPPALLAIPPLRAPRPDDPLDAALCAVVEIFAGDSGGSGTLLSPDGLILTNAHVVADYADRPIAEAVVAAPLHHGRPAVELFRAEVLEFDAERDLSLLRVTGGLYGQPLPAGYRFPTVPLGDPATLRLGDPLWAVGYPWTGGTGTRASITLTAGIVSGFEELPYARLVKTDSEIASGNSGGAALTRTGELIGVPTTIMEDRSSQLSFIVPVSAIPESWRARLSSGGR